MTACTTPKHANIYPHMRCCRLNKTLSKCLQLHFDPIYGFYGKLCHRSSSTWPFKTQMHYKTICLAFSMTTMCNRLFIFYFFHEISGDPEVCFNSFPSLFFSIFFFFFRLILLARTRCLNNTCNDGVIHWKRVGEWRIWISHWPLEVGRAA